MLLTCVRPCLLYDNVGKHLQLSLPANFKVGFHVTTDRKREGGTDFNFFYKPSIPSKQLMTYSLGRL